MGNWYNGYDWAARNAILIAARKGDPGSEHFKAQFPCGLCGDPNRPLSNWHSEDYSKPFSFKPPQSYPMCNVCHSRLHKRFAAPAGEWELFIEHVRRGGYGREFTKLLRLTERRRLADKIASGTQVELAKLRDRRISDPWWERLSCNPDTLRAAWARPRPLRPRPSIEEYVAALATIEPTQTDWSLLRAHASSPHQSATMRALANALRPGAVPSEANLAYGKLARRIAEATNFEVDTRKDGSPIWMSSVAEGWQPEEKGREYEWVMISGLVSAVEVAQTAGVKPT